MKISRIIIRNFRSIKEADFSLTDFNIFVGQNNCGKTNFFEAMEFFYNGVGKGVDINDLKFKRNQESTLEVSIEFSDALEGASKMQNDGNRTKIEKVLAGNDLVTVTRTSNEPKKRIVSVNGSEVNPGTGFDQALNDFLPKFEYISTKQYYDSVAKYSKTTPIGIMLSGVLNTILQKDPQYKEFQEKFRLLFEDDKSQIRAEFDAMGSRVKINLEKQFPDTTSVKFEVTPPIFDDLLKNFETSVDDGVETSAEEKGDGMQRGLMLAIIQAYADFRKSSEDLGKSFLFFIDEAELHLHPTAQRKLKKVLHELSKDTDQVFINTHSSVFIADNDDGQSLFKVEKNEGETDIRLVADNEKPYIVFELLGGSPADLLLPRNFLIVEGQSEYEFLTRVINRFYSDAPVIQIIQAHGDVDQAERTINAIEKLFTPLNTSIYRDRLVILMDHPSEQTEGGVRDFKARYGHLTTNGQIDCLPVRDLEQYYPNHADPVYTNWQKTQADMDLKKANDKKVFDGKKKIQLAKHVGNSITQAQFEEHQPIIHAALKSCWERCY